MFIDTVAPMSNDFWRLLRLCCNNGYLAVNKHRFRNNWSDLEDRGLITADDVSSEASYNELTGEVTGETIDVIQVSITILGRKNIEYFRATPPNLWKLPSPAHHGDAGTSLGLLCGLLEGCDTNEWSYLGLRATSLWQGWMIKNHLSERGETLVKEYIKDEELAFFLVRRIDNRTEDYKDIYYDTLVKLIPKSQWADFLSRLEPKYATIWANRLRNNSQ